MRPTDGVTDEKGYAGSPRPIFVRGIMHRTGTNFLQDLVALHPDVEAQTNVYEDHLFAESDLLVRYAQLTTSAWPGHATACGSACDDLLRSLGEALTRHLAAGITTPWFVTKMPSMDGVGAASTLFPGSPVLIVVRDGRAVAESAVATFDVAFDREVARWADGARAALELAHNDSPDVIIVRYEELVSNLPDTMCSVLQHVGLDVARYPFAVAAALPVRGSSELADRGGVHWSPVERGSISPERRGLQLSSAHKAIFDRLAGDELEALGYQRDAPPFRTVDWITVPSKERLVWSGRRRAGRVRRALRRRL